MAVLVESVSAEPDSAGRAAPGARLLGPGLAVGLPIVVWLVHSARYGQWLVDDALITVAYVRTLTEGGGYAQQSGAAPVEGISNPLWAVVLAALRLVGLFDRGRVWWGMDDVVVVFRVLALIGFAATLACWGRLTGFLVPRSGRWVVVGLAGTVLALSPSYVVWAISGLENPLYGLLVALLALVLATGLSRRTLLRPGPALISGLVTVLLAATRPDGLIYLAAYPCVSLVVLLDRERVLRLPRLAAASAVYGVAAGVPIAVLLLLRWRTFALWVPNTAVAKAQPGLSLDSLHRAAQLAPAAGAGLVALAAVAAGWVGARVIRGRGTEVISRGAPLLGVLVPFGLAVTAYGVLKQDWMTEYRFATPAAVLGSLLLATVVVWAVEPLLVGGGAARRIAIAVLALVPVIALVGAVPRITRFAAEATVPGCFVADRYGRTFNLYADVLGVEQGTLLLPDIGGTLLTTRLEVVDLAGLTEPTIAELRRARDWSGLRRYVLEDVQPTFVHLHRPWDAGLSANQRFRRDYVQLAPGDFVRRDQVRMSAVRTARSAGTRYARELGRQRSTDPLVACGPMISGQTP